MIQHFEVEIKGYKGYDMAQVTAGGVSTKEIIQGTLESKLLEGLYVVGELLDVDGTCGGIIFSGHLHLDTSLQAR